MGIRIANTPSRTERPLRGVRTRAYGFGGGLAKDAGGKMRTYRKFQKTTKASLSVPLVLFTAITLSGCMSAAAHRAAIRDDSSERLTVGTVQRKIRIGMPASDVASVMGSPNIVTTDEERREVWIYDKISTERVYSTSEGGVSTLILGGALVGSGLLGGAGGAYGSQSAGAGSTSQRTLTVIIKFGKDMKVRDFSYHSSRF